MKLELFLKGLALTLDYAVRYGAEQDTPEGERYIRMSDTVARQIIHDARMFLHPLESGKLVLMFTEDLTPPPRKEGGKLLLMPSPECPRTHPRLGGGSEISEIYE